MNIILYSILGLIGIAVIITLVIRSVRKKKQTPEDEIETILKEQEKLKAEQGLGNLEDINEHELDELIEKQ